jgi:hypothetical protein
MAANRVSFYSLPVFNLADKMEIELGIPVAGPVTGNGHVTSGWRMIPLAAGEFLLERTLRIKQDQKLPAYCPEVINF